MVARTGTETISTRTGAIALPLGVILLVVSTAIHPSGDVMDNPAIFTEYADSDGWIAIHFAQWVAGLLLTEWHSSGRWMPGRALPPTGRPPPLRQQNR